MRLLLRLYPAKWRERYGEEFAAFLDEVPGTPRQILDVVFGAIDTHWSWRLGDPDVPPAASSSHPHVAVAIGAVALATEIVGGLALHIWAQIIAGMVIAFVLSLAGAWRLRRYHRQLG